MFHCLSEAYTSMSIGPGTNVSVCEEHYTEFRRALAPEDPNQYEDEKT